LAEPTFDRVGFARPLTTRKLGRVLIARARVGSTNDAAWDALAQGAPEGAVVVADDQERGRGREGRGWHTAPGKGLALSLILHSGCERDALAALPLAVGLALTRALRRLGCRTRLKWPNDVLAGERKLAGVLCETRRLPAGAPAGDAVVVGVGINVRQQQDDFPSELRAQATSLAMEGCRASRERVAAAFLNELEPLWNELQEDGPSRVVAAWKNDSDLWGRSVTVRTPAGPVVGIARDLDARGALVLERDDGATITVLAGDLEDPAIGADRERP
jgi:BirA family biotin operon repressor/biotin-[acetyl-CoA-carboxylase] ligase